MRGLFILTPVDTAHALLIAECQLVASWCNSVMLFPDNIQTSTFHILNWYSLVPAYLKN